MATFKYVAVTPDGTKVRAATDSSSAAALRNDLTLNNFRVLKVREKKAFADIEVTKQRVPRQTVMHFTRQIAAFVRAGIPITDALQVVQEGIDNRRFRAIVAEMNESLHSGVPFSEALAGHAGVLPPYYLGIVRSAEQTGRLDSVLDQLADYMERDIEASQKLRSAITYPIVIAVAAVGVVVLMATYVLPKLTSFFKQFGVKKLPLTTHMLLSVSDFFKNYWWVTPLVLASLVAGIVFLRSTERGQLARDKALLKLWISRDLVRFAAVERFCRIIGAMMRAGVPLPEAMNAAMQSVNNKVFEQRLATVNAAILEGEGMAQPIAASGVFPHAAVQMMRVGEETGTLDAQLDVAAGYYGAELEYKLKKVMAMMEPAVIVFMGFIVGFVAVAMVQSIYSMAHVSKF
jgi:type IV pilus assembly protein PilC